MMNTRDCTIETKIQVVTNAYKPVLYLCEIVCYANPPRYRWSIVYEVLKPGAHSDMPVLPVYTNDPVRITELKRLPQTDEIKVLSMKILLEGWQPSDGWD